MRGLAVLLVDDVVTTGATLRAAAQALHAAGVDRVQLVAAASTQLRPIAGAEGCDEWQRGVNPAVAKVSAATAGRL